MFGDMNIIDFFIASPTMVVLLVCSIITVGFAMERVFYFKSSSINARRFMKELGKKLGSGNASAALDHCRKNKGAVARVMEQGVAHLSRTQHELAQRMTTAIEVEQVEMERNLSVLGTMSNIAPLLGLFGTVVGIIRAFAAIARTGSGGSSVVAMGVSEALMTTAAGIIVAVIATVFSNFFVRKIRTRTVELEDAREEFFSILSELTPARRPAPAAADRQTERVTQQDPAPASFLS